MGNTPAFKGKHHSAEAKAKLAKAHIGKDYLTERGRQIISQACTNRVVSEETRKKMSSRAKARRARIKSDPEKLARFTARMMAAQHVKPNKLERQLGKILNRNFPGTYRYNGDFSLGITLGGLIPDFVNVNGKKQVIEVFGDYWHSVDNIRWNYTELGRVMAYNSLGYYCLVIWEHEIKGLNEEQLVNKIKAFFRKEEINAQHIGISRF